ncbi:oligopeptide transporter, OPT family [Desulfosporosinus fructosivorans]|uniref:Oligopeptide transporter, OPT family n=1 Tax=Desulfosporosinus fructosivorans TaxID=2018669 RepID=A0A4Z0QZ11_9FIRM|nr:oligopeptide transporter, OPT family [Desulfosporosinus fructosivorans]TGE35758.1 oligopeptide transporter, OPT family [Desulfosporosinus fructosivorans]
MSTTINEKLSSSAYGGIKGDEYIPFVPTSEVMPETTGYSFIIGILFACMFAAANTYLGLKVGMTISAGIPGAILGIGLLKGAFKRNSILEANFVASLSAMGESIAGGIIFVLPALILLGFGLSIIQVAIVTVVGGIMGVFFITPLRRFLIVEEHGELVFPEAMAAAEVLVAGSAGGSGFKTVVTGIGAGGIYKFISGGLGFWPETASYTFTRYQGTQIGVDALASLLGVGFIIGTKSSALMFGGGVIAWFAMIPMISFIGAGLAAPIFPGTIPISEMSASNIWSNYIRYIGTGAVATGGIISLVTSLPAIVSSFKQSLAGIGGKNGGKVDRMNLEAPLLWVVGAAAFGFLATWLIPVIGGGLLGGVSALIFSFFFAVVSARMVGIIGASSNPVSGMTIATLLVVTSLLKITGVVGDEGIKTALLIAGVVCVAIAVAGGTAQSLKTTFIIGGTPKKVQIGMFIALSVASVVAGGVVLLLDKAYGIGTPLVAAPQASLMKLIVEGIMTAQLPWTLVLVGAAIAIFCALASIPILPVALGIYLPISLSSPVLIGGIIRKIVEAKFKENEERKAGSVERGILLASGLVAGDALIGILIAAFAVLEVNIGIGATLFPALAKSNLFSFIMFMALGTWVYIFAIKKNKGVE